MGEEEVLVPGIPSRHFRQPPLLMSVLEAELTVPPYIMVDETSTVIRSLSLLMVDKAAIEPLTTNKRWNCQHVYRFLGTRQTWNIGASLPDIYARIHLLERGMLVLSRGMGVLYRNCR